ncbi:hypothetical protein ANO11243_066830 [Dothideomycetidae sp. 11243]|nr:hypothetical protein ANO11243_066830 [fungal sp. No.11243]
MAMGFSLFSRLPLELRILIWRFALPESVGQILCPYRESFWRIERLLPGNPGYEDHEPNSEDEEDIDYFKPQFRQRFRYDLFGRAWIAIPAYYVNQEARTVATDWMQKNEFANYCPAPNKPRRSITPLVFVRPLDLCRDAIYIPLHEFSTFESPRSLPQIYNCFDRHSDAKQFAVSERLLYRHQGEIAETLLRNHPYVKVLLVVIESDLDCDEDHLSTHWHEFEELSTGSFFWNLERNVFDFNGIKKIGYEDKYKSIEDAIQTFPQASGWALDLDTIAFEVRPVLATQRIEVFTAEDGFLRE